MKAVFPDFDSIGPADLDLSALHATLPEIRLFGSSTAAEVRERIAGCEILIVNKVHLDRKLLAANPSLRLVCLAATGSDNIDLHAARELGITVCNIRNYCTASVVQHVFGMLLSLNLHLDEYRRLLADGSWQRSAHFCLLDHPVRELAGRTFGIVGYGELGRAVAQTARAFGMRVLVSHSLRPDAALQNLPADDPPVERMTLPGLLAVSDVLSLHCPLTPDTRHLINAESLRLMRADAVLINTARGALVDESALLEALRAGRLGGAGIDVLAEEPPASGNPLLEVRLPNLLVTPHIAWAAREARQRALDQVVANVRAFLNGQACNTLS
ncbi:MAG: D-2-hydroxyacid dehydrogenase [Gammaproteobacteria bacterium]|nr:D-2-hydroxyacid dehydrogenase [Gammaproteobacteria bacterium]